MDNNIISITVRIGDDGSLVKVRGRDAWTLHHLLIAGERGCTPIETPGPRWSHYCWKLRKAGIAVETVTEPYGGTYRGTHARYVLRTPVEVIEREVA